MEMVHTYPLYSGCDCDLFSFCNDYKLFKGSAPMTFDFNFLSGFGCATFLIFGWQVLYELVRHRSMLEYPTPDIPTEFCIFALVGLVIWFVGAYFGVSP